MNQSNSITLIPGLCTGIKRSDSSKSSVSLGILSLASILNKDGFDVKVVNLDVLMQNGHLCLGPNFYEDAVKNLLKTNAMIYGFYLAVGLLHYVVEIAAQIKTARSDAIIVLGGPHASVVHEKIIRRFPEVDAVFRSESECSFLNFCRAVRDDEKYSAISGTTVRMAKDVNINPDVDLIDELDTIPQPAYALYPKEDSDRDVVSIDAGRGCPHKCTFCSTSLFWRRSSRMKSIRRLVIEMQDAHDQLGADKVFLMHDCFTAHKHYVEDFCRALIAAPLPLEWGCATRLDHLQDMAFVELLVKAGCTHLELGIESGSHRIRGRINKQLGSNKQILDDLGRIKDCGFSLVLYFMCGFPEESENEVEDTLDLIGESALLLKGNGFFRLSPLEVFSGTDLSTEFESRLVYYPQRIAPNVLNTYTPRCLELARREPLLFPELYHIPNRHGLGIDYFLDIGSLYSHMVRIITIEFYNLCRYLRLTMSVSVRDLSRFWINFEKKLGRSCRRPDEIAGNMEKFIHSLAEDGLLSDPEPPLDILRYEKAAMRCRDNYLHAGNVIHPDGAGAFGIRPHPALQMVDLKYDIARIIKCLDENTVPAPRLASVTVVALPVTSEKIKMIKLNNAAIQFMGFCNGFRSRRDIVVCMAKAMNLDDDCELDEAMDKLCASLLHIGILVQ